MPASAAPRRRTMWASPLPDVTDRPVLDPSDPVHRALARGQAVDLRANGEDRPGEGSARPTPTWPGT